jgi:hypothetical protein
VSIRRASDSPGKSDACPSAEYPRHFLTENVGLQGGLSFPPEQTVATNRMIQKGLNLVPGGGAFFTPLFSLCNLLKTGCARTAKSGKPACLGHNLGTVKWGEPLG